MTQADERDVGHANAILLNKCLGEGGRDFPRAAQDWAAIPMLPDRRYGVWAKADAASNGYELPMSAASKALDAQEDALGDDWWKAYEACRSELQLFPLLGVNTTMDPSPVDVGMQESFEAVIASPEFAAARDEWKSCIVAAGLTPNPSAKLMVPEIPAAGEEQFRVAALDVACKESLNSVQPLADFEARKQAAYIKKHESELTKYRSGVDEVLAAVQKVLTTNG